MKSNTRVIIDGNNFIFRAYFAKKKGESSDHAPFLVNGIDTGTIHKALVMLKNMMISFNPKEVVIAWDEKLNVGGTNFRKQAVPYKEQRVDTDEKKKIYEYVQMFKPIAHSLGIKTIFPYNLEADDIIAFLVQCDDMHNIIISSDRDMLQLISENVNVYSPTKKIVITPDNFEELIDISKDLFLLQKAIMGDVSDNIDGIKGFGPAKSKKLALDISHTGIDSLPVEQKTIIERNLNIMDLSKGFPLEIEHYQTQYNVENSYDADLFQEICKKYKFNNFIREIGSWTLLFNN